jgi:hypothetical protein
MLLAKDEMTALFLSPIAFMLSWNLAGIALLLYGIPEWEKIARWKHGKKVKKIDTDRETEITES